MTGTTVEQIREGFNYPTLDRQPGLPSYNTINSVHTFLKTKRRLHGLLGLVLDDTIYLNFTGTNFIQPPNPGTVATIPTNSTELQIDERVVRSHKDKLREWRKRTPAPTRLYNNN